MAPCHGYEEMTAYFKLPLKTVGIEDVHPRGDDLLHLKEDEEISYSVDFIVFCENYNKDCETHGPDSFSFDAFYEIEISLFIDDSKAILQEPFEYGTFCPEVQ